MTQLITWLDEENTQAKLSAALGDWIDPTAFGMQMLTAFKDDKVRACSDASKMEAVLTCATLRLLPTLDQVSLIPYGDTLRCMPEYRGYKALMERHPNVLEVIGEVVHALDSYAFQNGEFVHSYDPFDEARQFRTLEDMRGGYVKVLYADGRPVRYHFVPMERINKARACAKSKNVWDSWPWQMALKTCYRDAYARRIVPIDPTAGETLQKVLNHDDIVLGNDPSLSNMKAVSRSQMMERQAAQTKKTTKVAQAAKQAAPPEPEPEPEYATPDELTDDELYGEPALTTWQLEAQTKLMQCKGIKEVDAVCNEMAKTIGREDDPIWLIEQGDAPQGSNSR